MFRGLRLRLTALYALAALALVAVVGGGAYLVVARYLRGVTDLALAHKMTHEFHALAAPIPPELVPADRDWSLLRGELGLLSGDEGGGPLSERDAVAVAAAALGGGRPERVRLREEHGRWQYEVRFAGGARVLVERDGGQAIVARGDEDDDDRESWSPVPTATPEPAAEALAYDAELAAIYVLPLDAAGSVLFDPNSIAPPLAPDAAALSVALATGNDLRTVTAPDGQRVRLLTYRLTRPDGPAALQLGRVLNDQDQVLRQLMLGLLALSAVSVVLIGAASWWLAGRALQPAQAAWERQQRFIASASHELRTPLTLIRASTEVALRGLDPADGDSRELLDDVLAESDHMRRLVDDLLTLTRLDSGRLQLNPIDVDLAVLLAETQRQTARLGDERGVAVSLGDAAGVVRADVDRLRQVLLNLIDNALRHTPPGGSVCLAASPQGRGVRICVSDSGCGIAPEHLPHIFERFYRADPARGREGGNAGLGLSIARGLVEAMGGQIGAESVVGRGTTVWMVLPGT